MSVDLNSSDEDIALELERLQGLVARKKLRDKLRDDFLKAIDKEGFDLEDMGWIENDLEARFDDAALVTKPAARGASTGKGGGKNPPSYKFTDPKGHEHFFTAGQPLWARENGLLGSDNKFKKDDPRVKKLTDAEKEAWKASKH